MKPSNQELINKYIEELKKCKKQLKLVEEMRHEFTLPNHRYFSLLPFEQEMLKKGANNRKVELEQQINKCYRQIGKYSI